MALQGTLDTFELPDVLRLLASTRKTGRLHLRGDRGEGDVWLADGQVVGVATAGAGDDVADGLFELLRAHEGAFAFEPDEAPAAPGQPTDVEPLLVAAEARLVEWREIEAVVPSVAALVVLEPELPTEDVTVDAGTWRLVATIGDGTTVGELGERLRLGEVAVSKVVRDLVALGLVAVRAPVAAIDTQAASLAPTPAPAPEPPLAAPEPMPEVVEQYERFEPPAPADDDDGDEVARQLAMLSPRAAQAVAAVASSVDEEADVTGEDDADEPANRGLLLKFLGSVKT